ncbi:MAG: pitrilysin family protein [Gemmatimonadaceae bacterium]
MNSARIFGVTMTLASLAVLGGRDGRAQAVRPIAYSRFVLQNGLVALVNEDHSAPLVAVDVWYHVGAKDEQQGHTGLSHLCEHLMGEGSPNEPLPAKVFIQSIGGTSAHWGATSEDVTHFFATAPSNQLETMLWLESDRMAAPLSRADSTHVASVKSVIAQERAQNRETPVFGVADGLTLEWLFPPGSPYAIDPVGPMTYLRSATAADAKAFCLPYYVPNNAIVSLSGDVTAANAKILITKYFGDIARGATPPRATIPDLSPSPETRAVLEDARARVPRLRIAWPGAAFSNPDRVALKALVSVLTRDRTGRLSKALVYDLGLATRVVADNFDDERAGIFQIEVFPRPEASLTRIEQVVDSVIAMLPAQPATREELEAFAKSNAVLATTTLQTRAMRADTLAHGEVFAGDPVAYAKQAQRAFDVTSADVTRVARQYLTGHRVVLSMVPAGKLNLISKPTLPYQNITPASQAKVTP